MGREGMEVEGERSGGGRSADCMRAEGASLAVMSFDE